MEDITRDILFVVAGVIGSIWYWVTASEKRSRIYMLFCGLSVVVTGGSHLIIIFFDIAVINFVTLLGILGMVYFFIKAWLSERRARTKST